MRIGITGGICSGKTTICKQLEELGYPVFYSDIEAKYLANNDVDVIEQIIIMFGYSAYCNGFYNTKYISSIVFGNTEKLDLLNSIFRPKLRERFDAFCVGKDVVIYESALIYEHNINYLDYIINVYCDLDTIKKRIAIRDNRTEDEIENILNRQMHPDTKRDIAKYNVTNFQEALDYIKSFYYLYTELKN